MLVYQTDMTNTTGKHSDDLIYYIINLSNEIHNKFVLFYCKRVASLAMHAG